MLIAMAILIATATVLQIYIGDLYEMLHVQNGAKVPGLDFLDRMVNGLRGHAVAIILLIIGIWLIKLNFMLLFYRIGYQIQSYLVLWWVALVVVLACGAVNLGLVPYDCELGSIMHISMECAQQSRVRRIYMTYIVTIVVDVFSDLISKYFRAVGSFFFH